MLSTDAANTHTSSCCHYSATALLAMTTVVFCLSVRPFDLPTHSSVLCTCMKIRSCGYSIKKDNHSSFWWGNVYPDNRRGSPAARALKWGTPMSIAKIWPTIGHNFGKWCKIGGKLVIFTNRKSHMGFRLVPKSVTSNDLERRNGRVVCVISPNLVAFGAYYLKVVEDTPIHSRSEM